MKKTLFIFGFISMIIMNSCNVQRNLPTATEEEGFITVSGTGSVSVVPDIVSLKFLVRTTGWNVSQVVERNANSTNNALTAIKAVGIDSNDIGTYDYKITQDNTKDYPGQYTAINTISVVIRDTAITGKVIDAAVKQNTGANGITSFEYSVTDKSSALRQARTLAIQNAQDAANLLAGASGCKVGKVVDIREDYTSTANRMVMKAVAFDGTTPIETGTIDISSNVTVKYKLIN